MSDRLIFRIKYKNKTLAYLMQNWGMGDSAEIEKLVKKAAKEYNLNLTKRLDAVTAVRIAGEEQYGHALWNFIPNGETDEDFIKSVERDIKYLKRNKKYIIADNQDEKGIRFFYGTFEDYPKYIESWCCEDYTMFV